MTPLRFGIIGNSRISKRQFLPALDACKEATLITVGSRSSDVSYDDVLANPEIDCVYISLPASLHLEWILKALDAGKHVICEKPAVMSLEDAKKVLKKSHEVGRIFFENYTPRFHSQHLFVKEQLMLIGDPIYFHGTFTFPMPEAGDIRLNPDLGGGVYWDALGYPVMAYLDLFGEVPQVVHRHEVTHSGHGVSQIAALTLTGKCLGHVMCGMGLQFASTYSITGEKGKISLGRAYAVTADMKPSIRVEKGMETDVHTMPSDFQFLNALNHFCTRVRENNTQHKWDEFLFLGLYRVLN
jgi:predicted dehydrogenase